MADTIAVMNGGRIEQLGSPAELYELPRTTFAANFLGQSNLLAATVIRHVRRRPAARRARLPRRAARARGPRRETATALARRPPREAAGGRRRRRGQLPRPASSPTRPSPASPPTTSCALPWDQELTVVQQNDGTPPMRAGEPVTVTWLPAHGFAPRRRRRTSTPARSGSSPRREPGRRPPRDRRPHLAPGAGAGPARGRGAPARRRRATPYLLLLPGALCLALLSSRRWCSCCRSRCRPARSSAATALTFRFATYADVLSRYHEQLLRSLLYAGLATVLALRHRLPAGVRDRVQVGPLEERPAGPRHRPVLHQLPHPHAGLADHPHQRGPRHAGAARDRRDGRPALPRVHRRRPAARLAARGRHRADLQLPAVHGAAAVRQPGARRPAAHRGRRRPVRLAVDRLPQGHVPAVAARRRRRHAAHLHPGGRRLHQRPAARQPADHDDRPGRRRASSCACSTTRSPRRCRSC